MVAVHIFWVAGHSASEWDGITSGANWSQCMCYPW